MKLKDKVAVITGAGSGIGRSIAYHYAREGAKVVAADINLEGVESLILEAKDFPGEITPCRADVTKRDEVEKMIDLAVEKYGTLDILVNNAGIMDRNMPVNEIDDEMWERVMAINTTSVMYGCRHAVNIMLKKGKGCIINISSIAAIGSCRAGVAYTASKYAVLGMSKNIGYMYATKGIRCNAICPGFITSNIGDTMQNSSPFGTERAEIGYHLSPRNAPADELASAAVFLASDDASFVNATAITVDGGWTAY